MTPRDQHARELIIRHHAELVAAVRDRTARVADAAAATPRDVPDSARREFVSYFVHEILPHASAEEDTLYQAAVAAGLDQLSHRISARPGSMQQHQGSERGGPDRLGRA